MPTFLKLLGSNLVSKPYLVANLNFWCHTPPHPQGWEFLGGTGTILGVVCCDHILGAIELKLGMQTSFGCEINFLKSNPPSPQGGSPGGGLCVGGRWVVASFLKLLSSNLVCKPYLGANFDL